MTQMKNSLRFQVPPTREGFTFIEHSLSQVIMKEDSSNPEKILFAVKEILKAKPDMLVLFGETKHLELVTRHLRNYQSVLSVPMIERSQFCMLAWKSRRFSLLSRYSIDLTINDLNGTESLGMICNLRHNSGKELYLCTAQLAPDNQGKTQLLQLKGFLSLIRQTCDTNSSLLISGNFNITPTAELYNLFKGNLNLRKFDIANLNLAGGRKNDLKYSDLVKLASSFSLKWNGNSAQFKKKRTGGYNTILPGIDTTNVYVDVLDRSDFPTFFARDFRVTCDYIFHSNLLTVGVLENSDYLPLLTRSEFDHLPIGASLEFKNNRN